MVKNNAKMSRVYQYAEYKLHSSILALCAYGVIRSFFRFYVCILAILPVSKKKSGLGRSALEEVFPKPEKKKISYVNKKDALDLSIIIPVYNAESTLEMCLAAVFCQKTSYSYEIIAIDDGSKDKSLDILNELKNKNPALKVISKENDGAASSRNIGINEATGKYLMFIDADDLLNEGAIEKMMDVAVKNDADLVQGSWKYIDGSIQRYPDGKCTKEQLVELMGVPWGKVMKRSLFDDVRFPQEFTSYVDTNIKWIIYPKSDNAFMLKDVVYSWRKSEGGITFLSKKSARAMQAYWIFEDAIEEYKAHSLPMGKLFDMTFMRQTSVTYHRIVHFDEEIKLTIFEELRKFTNLFGDEHLSFPYAKLRRAFKKNDYRSYQFIASRWDYLL